jgi:hypothetical protein
MRTDTRVFFRQVVRTDRTSASHITQLPGRLDVLDYSLFLTEIRLTYLMQRLVVYEFGGRLSFLTLRAVADGSTLDRARSLSMDPAEYVSNSDSHSFFKSLGDDLTCGPTQNNVRDIRVLLSLPGGDN